MSGLRFAWVPVAAGALALAWSGYDVTEGGMRLAIGELAPVTDPASPAEVILTVSNGCATGFRGTVSLRGFVDDWKAHGPSSAPVVLAPGTATNLSFHVASGAFVFDALYPVHAYLLRDGGRTEPLHTVRIFEVRRPRATRIPRAGAPEVLRLQADSALPLWQSRAHRFGWVQDRGGPPVEMPAGWTGSDERSHTGLSIGAADCGGSREAMGMHVPYHGGAGRCWVDWTVDLPSATPLTLTFATALHHAGETDTQRSDGILYRVSVADASTPQDRKTLHEDFTDARRWKEGRLNLDAYAGRRVLLRLESDPGPKRNTAFDHSWWAEPVLVSGRGGPAARRLDPPTLQTTESVVRKALALLSGATAPDGRTTFILGPSDAASRTAVVVEPGPQGLLDALVAFAVEGGGTAAFRGFEIDVENAPVGRFPSPFAFLDVATRASRGRVKTVHSYTRDGAPFDLTITLCAEGPALRIAAECPKRITRFRVGPWDRPAPRVFFGHGFCVTDPKPFQQSFGGHNLASSHVAAEFGDGIAVLQAFDNPPDFFRVDPAARVVALQSHHDATLTLLPGRAAMACATAYRPLDPREAAGGVGHLAGRFCFDIWDWSGRYGKISTNMVRMFRYGLTDSFLTVHNWQRWGYDYRLPDIWPPNPGYGTVADLRSLGDACRARGVPWGLHDNYIDFYPDAEGYTYRKIYFTPDGRPNTAWYNEGRDARSYKWRPDEILPYVKRNTKLIRDGVAATHSFVDVFTSLGCVDTWDHEGRLHPATETRRHWGEAFAKIRDILGDNAPTTSEAGHDQLIGWLDGADCQWLRLTSQRPALHSIFLECGSWTRVPWMDAVHHHRFNLHGAGYSIRFEGGLGRAAHGIHSDEYLACEMLAGHSPMVDAQSWGRPAVRKYWLMQDVIRALALHSIKAHAFDGARLDRQRIEWDNGAVVRVNLGGDDWPTAGAVLPPNGWTAVAGAHTASVERLAGRFRIMAGLFDKHSRKPLQGADDGEGRIWIGTLVVARSADGALAGVTFDPPTLPEGLPAWLNPPGTKSDFGWAVTDGAFRIERVGDDLLLVPLPDLEPFDIVLRLAYLPGAPVAVTSVVAEPMDPSAEAKPVGFKTANGRMTLRHDGETFGYRIVIGGAR